MARTEQNFEMLSGDTKHIIVSLKNSSGNDQDISDLVSITWAVKKHASGSKHLLSKQLDYGIEITDAIKGRFRIILYPDDTKELSGFYYHEAQVVDRYGNVSTIFTGSMQISMDGIN